MKPQPAPRAARRSAGFSLVEIVLSIGIIATVLVGVIGLLPAGLNASREATNHTVVATILEDVHHRLEAQPLELGPASFSPAFYDDLGVYVSPNASDEAKARRLYRVDLEIVNWQTQPNDTSSLKPVSIKLSWPVDLGTGEAIGPENPRTVVTFPVTTLTGPDWQAIDPDYVQKVEY